jgi:hypothetical protein
MADPTVVAVTPITRSGVFQAEAAADAVNGNSVLIGPRTFLVARNAHATLAKTLTFDTPGTVDAQAIANRVESIPALTTEYFGPFSDDYRQANGTVKVTAESVDIMLSAYRIP